MLHVSTTAERWSFEVGRDGATYEPLLRVDDLQDTHHDTPAECSVAGCDWPKSTRFTVPEGWRPGGYLDALAARPETRPARTVLRLMGSLVSGKDE